MRTLKPGAFKYDSSALWLPTKICLRSTSCLADCAVRTVTCHILLFPAIPSASTFSWPTDWLKTEWKWPLVTSSKLANFPIRLQCSYLHRQTTPAPLNHQAGPTDDPSPHSMHPASDPGSRAVHHLPALPPLLQLTSQLGLLRVPHLHLLMLQLVPGLRPLLLNYSHSLRIGITATPVLLRVFGTTC